MRLVPLVLALAVTVSQSSAPSRNARALEKIEIFAFGGTGFTLAISDGEKLYRAVLSGPSAASEFEHIFAAGNPQAKAYALAGLRQTNVRKFETLVKRPRVSDLRVLKIHGCIISTVPLSEIIANIRAGVYSGPLTNNLVPPPQNERP